MVKKNLAIFSHGGERLLIPIYRTFMVLKFARKVEGLLVGRCV